MRDHRASCARPGGTDPRADSSQPVVRVGACDRGTPVRVDEKHGLPVCALPGPRPQRLGLRADGGSVQLQKEFESGQAGGLARSLRNEAEKRGVFSDRTVGKRSPSTSQSGRQIRSRKNDPNRRVFQRSHLIVCSNAWPRASRQTSRLALLDGAMRALHPRRLSRIALLAGLFKYHTQKKEFSPSHRAREAAE